MWSSDNPISDENLIPDVQNVHRKSVGRTPLKTLTGQQLDPNALVNKRSSLSKTSKHSALMTKDSTRVSTGTSVSVSMDLCHTESFTESSKTKVKPSKKRPSCSLLETEVSEGDSPALLTGPENCDQSSQLCDVVILSQPKDSSDSQTASGHNEGNRRPSVNNVAHSLHLKSDKLISLPSTITSNELTVFLTSPALEDHAYQMVTLMLNEPKSHDDGHSVLIPGSASLKHVTEPDKIPIENLDSKDEDNIAVNDLNPNTLYISKPEISLPCVRNNRQLEDLLIDGELGVEEPNAVVSANITYEIDPPLHAVSDQCAGTVIDVLSEVTEIIGSWNSSINGSDYFQVEAAHDERSVKGSPQVETLSAGTVVNDRKETQLFSGSQETFDPVVTNNSGWSLPDTLPIEEALLPGPEMSLLCNSLSHVKTSANKCCTLVDVVPTDHILTEDNPTSLTHTKWFSPVSNMDPVCEPNPSHDPGSCPTPIMPNPSKFHEIPLLGKGMCKNITPKMFVYPQEAGTSSTPVSTNDGVTWTTPIMLLNKSMNTSCNTIGKGEKSAKDDASETDSVLWNFSRETLCNASRDELMDRLEGTLIVVEVLSRQLQGWQQNKVSSKPSEQRECTTQTCVTYTSTEEQYYHNLYSKTLNRLQSVQRSREQEDILHKHLKEATKALASHKNEASSMIEFAKNLYETAHKDRADLQQKKSHIRTLLADHTNILEKMSKKSKDCLLQRDEMRARMEKAIKAKDAADLCLQDLEIHSSSVITQLRRESESERQLCQSVKEAYKQQHSYNEELAEFVHRAQSVCSEVEDDRTQLQRQCSQARQLMTRHRRLFEVMKEKTQSALEELEEIKWERDMAVQENEKVYSDIESTTYQTQEMKLENSRLGSELELLMSRLCALESEIEQVKEENSELEELLSAKDTSMKLLEKELNEATARGREYQDCIKHLTGHIVPSLEMDLSKTLNQKQVLQKQLEMLAKEHDSQITYYTESLEFLEQENSVCREQMAEAESQLKTHHLTVLERNFQCEDLKDLKKELQKEVSDLQEKLSHSEEEAQNRVLKLSKEISDSSMEISNIKSHMLETIENMREDSKTKAAESLPGSQTPGQSLVPSMDEELTITNISAADSEDRREGIWSKTSAFTVVLPLISPSASKPQEHLPDVVRELSSIFADVVTTSSNAMEKKQQTIKDFKMEIESLKKELQSLRFQHTSEMRVLQEELGNLKRRNCVLDKKINCKEKCISELQEVVNQQEQKILQQFSEAKESEVLIQENAESQLSLKVCEKEVEVLKQELAQNSTEAARNWIQEKLLLHKDLTTLKLKLVDTEYSKSEAIQRLLRHRDVLKGNLACSDAEVKKLDNIIERARQDLLSIPDVVNSCDKLRRLMDFLN